MTPLSWDQAREKFDVLVTPFTGDKLRDEIAEIIHDLDNRQVSELTAALSKVSVSRG